MEEHKRQHCQVQVNGRTQKIILLSLRKWKNIKVEIVSRPESHEDWMNDIGWCWCISCAILRIMWWEVIGCKITCMLVGVRHLWMPFLSLDWCVAIFLRDAVDSIPDANPSVNKSRSIEMRWWKRSHTSKTHPDWNGLFSLSWPDTTPTEIQPVHRSCARIELVLRASPPAHSCDSSPKRYHHPLVCLSDTLS